MSHSVYWISLKHSQEVIEKKHHVPTIEDAFRIKSNEAKSAVLALCSSKVGPLLAVGRIAGVVEIYNTATFKLIQRVSVEPGRHVSPGPLSPRSTPVSLLPPSLPFSLSE